MRTGPSAGLALAALLLAALLAPLAGLVWSSFAPPWMPDGTPAGPGLHHHIRAWQAPGAVAAIGNALRFALGSALLATLLGALAAWLYERTRLPGRRLLALAMLAPLFVPGALYSYAWVLLASPRIGVLNLPFAAPPFNVYGHAGMAWVEGLHATPMVFLLAAAMLRSLDPERELAAQVSGASLWQTATRITLPMLAPVLGSAFLLVFIRAVGTFEVPAMLGLPAGIDVISSRIFQALRDHPGETGPAAAYAVALLVLTVLAIAIHERLVRARLPLAAQAFGGDPGQRLELGRARLPLGALALSLSVLVALLPLLAVLWSSVQPYYAVPGAQALQRLTLSGFREVLSSGQVAEAAWNTARLAAAAATLIMAAGLAAAWLMDRTAVAGRQALEPAINSVLALPGVVLGIAILVFHTMLDTGLHGTGTILLLAYLTRFLPYGLRYGRAALGQVPRELEQAAHCSGAGSWQTLRRVTLPLLVPGLLAGWMFVAIVAIRELSSALLLYTPGNEVVTVVFWQYWENGQLTELSALSVLLAAFLLSIALLANRLASRRPGR